MEKKIFAEDAVGKKMFAETYMLKKKILEIMVRP